MKEKPSKVQKRAVVGKGRDRLNKTSKISKPSKGSKNSRALKPVRPLKPVYDRFLEAPAGLVAKNPPPQPKLKHQSYYEFVKNTNKKKPLDYQVDSTDRPVS
jgi:hypothetical protein